MLQAIVSYAKQADVGIEDMTFEVSNEELSQSKLLFENIPEGILRALKEFAAALKDSSDIAEMNLRVGELKTSSLHRGIKKDGRMDMFSLELADESDGTRRLHSGVFLVFCKIKEGVAKSSLNWKAIHSPQDPCSILNRCVHVPCNLRCRGRIPLYICRTMFSQQRHNPFLFSQALDRRFDFFPIIPPPLYPPPARPRIFQPGKPYGYCH